MHDFDHYIALDWAKANMAIARLTKHGDKILDNKDVPANIEDLKMYLEQLKGKKKLTFEETTTSHWLYTKLKSSVDEILVCNPHRNKLLNDGPKTDKIDAAKLVKLLKANLLKPVYHSGEFFFDLRKLVSAYEDLIKRGVRVKNQNSAIYRALGIDRQTGEVKNPYEIFVIEGNQKFLDLYESEKKRFEKEFIKLCKDNSLIRNLETIPGIGKIGAVKLAAIIVDANRFKNKSAWLSYCGLVRLEKMSGGRSYGTRMPQYSRIIKSIFKTAAMATIQEAADNNFKDYYDYLIKEKNYAPHNARHTIARRIAVIVLGVFRNNKKFKEQWRCNQETAA